MSSQPPVDPSGRYQWDGTRWAPAQPPLYKRPWFIALLAVATVPVLLFTGCTALVLGAAAGGDPDTQTAAAPTTTARSPVTTSPPAQTVPTGAPGLGDGTYVVGEDIEPGRYQADGGGLCYWARLSSLSGEPDDVIINQFGDLDIFGEEMTEHIVEIQPSDAAFTTERCGRWLKID